MRVKIRGQGFRTRGLNECLVVEMPAQDTYCPTPTVKLEVQLRHRLPPSLERSGKGGGRRWKPGIRVIRQYKIKKGDLCLPRINYFCIVYEV